jgi:polyisoprenoid-binding protein YceI
MRMDIRRYLIASACAATCAAAHATDYRFDPVHTQVFFSASHLGMSNPMGRMHVKSGYIKFDYGDWTQARVDATIDTASLDMGDEAWNRRLRSGEFLDTDKFPNARFVSERVEKTGEREGIAHGKLTLLGVTRPLDLHVKFNRAGLDPYSLQYIGGFSADAKFKRSDFGIKKYIPDVGDEVSVHIEAEGLRGADTQEQAAPDAPGGL